MTAIQVVAIPTEVVDAVRTTMRAPIYGFPAHAELAIDDAPCRHCLRIIVAGVDRRILFTYDRFAGVEALPQPGPVYIHADDCPRYPGDGGFPEELRGSPRTLEAYARGRRLVTQEYVADGRFEPVIERLIAAPEVDYIQVNSTMAGCYTFRIERQRAGVAGTRRNDHATAEPEEENHSTKAVADGDSRSGEKHWPHRG
jgi:hypothetical protein